MVEISALPMMIPSFNFGKYRGQKVADVAEGDKGYLEWLLRQKEEAAANGDTDEDWIYTLKAYLK